MTTCDHLFVLWNAPEDGTRHVIGELWHEGRSGYAFAYRDNLPKSSGFDLLTEFPEHRTIKEPYRSPKLFPTFAQRIPSKHRPDFAELIQSWGVSEPSDPMEILARSGGVQMTDRIELAEYRIETDDLSRPLSFRVAGIKHQNGIGTDRLRIGDPLDLRRDPENQYDSCATLIVVRGESPLGRVPGQYCSIFARLLDGGRTIHATAERRLTLPTESGRWVVRAQSE